MSYNKIMEDNSFIKTLRDAQAYNIEDAERRSNIINDWSKTLDSFTEGYNQYLENNGAKKVSKDKAKTILRDFVKKAAVADGKWTQSQIDDGDYDETEFQEYGTNAIRSLFGETGGMTLDDYIEKNGDDDTKKYYKESNRERSAGEKIARGAGASAAVSGLAALGPLGWIGGAIGFGAGAAQDNNRKKKLSDLVNKYNEEHNSALNSGYDAIINADKYLENRRPEGESGSGSSNGSDSTSETTDEEVTFTLPKANDPSYKGFGQKLVDLGLATSKGLWGGDGDVQFYTKQLYEQGAIDSRGNLKVGVPIKLKKRKVK